MAALDLESFHTSPFRAMLACTVRGVRRVLPLVDESETGISLCQRIVGLAHSFAAGSQIEPIQLNETLNFLQKQSSEKPPSDTAQLARSAVQHLAECTGFGAHILMVADQFPHLLVRTVENDRPPAINAARLSFNAAWDASTGERASHFSSDEITIAAAAFQKDVQTLAAVPFSSEDWLGPPFNAGDEGRFGELWPHGTAPKWYGLPGPRLTIVSADDVDLEQLNTLTRPDVVCWYFGNSKNVDWSLTNSTMATLTKYYADNRMVPPVFVIFARGLDDLTAHQLIAEGATVFRNGLAGHMPTNRQELVELTAVMMRATGAHQQQSDFWQYAQRFTLLHGSAGWRRELGGVEGGSLP